MFALKRLLLYKHLQARTMFLEMYGEWAYIHEFSFTQKIKK